VRELGVVLDGVKRGEQGKDEDVYIGGLEGSLEDCYGVVLGCNIVEVLWSTGGILE
jgi:hypothetical protein